ncbi:MAG: tRNA-dihydrouridine synthase, partial [Firmicutes bacterium]|nr:tRNA-dihydrouridine synthase [Bacillota bacterium]
EKICEAIAKCKPVAVEEDCKIVASVAGQSEEETARIARAAQESGADAIEINMVCPATGPHLGPEYERLGKYWSETPDRAVSVISEVKKNVTVPVWAKCTLERLVNPDFLHEVDSGARPDAYSFIGGRTPCLVIDVETGKPKFPGNTLLRFEKGLPVVPMVTGPVKTSTVLHAAYLAKLTKTPLICSGGLSRGYDVIEALMAGAAAAGISTAVYRKRDVSLEILREIEEFMNRRGIDDLGSVVGCALQHIPGPPLLKVPGV